MIKKSTIKNDADVKQAELRIELLKQKATKQTPKAISEEIRRLEKWINSYYQATT